MYHPGFYRTQKNWNCFQSVVQFCNHTEPTVLDITSTLINTWIRKNAMNTEYKMYKVLSDLKWIQLVFEKIDDTLQTLVHKSIKKQLKLITDESNKLELIFKGGDLFPFFFLSSPCFFGSVSKQRLTSFPVICILSSDVIFQSPNE